MKKQLLCVFASLFVFAALLPMSAYAADAYAILYDDGELVFQNSNTPESGRAVTETYEVNLKSGGYPRLNGQQRQSVRVATFADKISPASTAFWFYNLENLTRIDNIQNLDTSNVTSMYCMFTSCSSLEELDVSGFDTSKVTNMDGLFSCCESLTTLDVSNFDTSSVTDMSALFNKCTALEELDISSFDTSSVTKMSTVFQYCSNLKTIYVSDKFTTASVTSSGSMFSGCRSLVGGAGTKYKFGEDDATYARIDNPPDAPGYFTAKSDAPAPVVYAITAVTPDKAAGKLSVTFTNPDAVTLAASYFDAGGKFVSADLQSVQADAKAAEFAFPSDVNAARVTLFDTDCRPLCKPFMVSIG